MAKVHSTKFFCIWWYSWTFTDILVPQNNWTTACWRCFSFDWDSVMINVRMLWNDKWQKSGFWKTNKQEGTISVSCLHTRLYGMVPQKLIGKLPKRYFLLILNLLVTYSQYFLAEKSSNGSSKFCILKFNLKIELADLAYSQVSYNGRSQNFQNLNCLHLIH